MARPEAKLKELKTAELKHEVGARKDLVITTNRRSERRLIAYGDDFLFEKLPVGTRVIYPPPPLEPLADPDQAIRYALLHPENADPLFAQLNPNMRITIAIDDISLPLPPMRRPDIRERLLNQVMQTLADYGVDDVHLIIATSLHRRMTEAEIRRMVGEKAFKQFWPDRLYNFDAENRAELTMMGKTDHGEDVWLSKRAADSDLVIYLNINLVPMDGGHKSVAVGLSPYASLRHHHNPTTLRDSHSYMDPNHSALHRSADRMGRVINSQLNVFTLETAVNNNMYGGMLDFMHKNEDQLHRLGSGAAQGLSVDDAQSVRRLAPADVAQLLVTIRDDGHLGGRDRGGASQGAGESISAIRGAGEGPVRHPNRRRAVHLPVQRQLDHESDPRAVHRAWLPVQHVSRQAAGA